MASERGSSDRAGTALRVACIAAGVGITAYSAYKLYSYTSAELTRQQKLQEYRLQLLPTPEQLDGMKQDFLKQLQHGLENQIDTNGRHMLMLPTYVTQLPTGHEQGNVYAIDLGGTNFRVSYVKLSADRSKVDEWESVEVKIPEELCTGKGTDLFDFLALQLVQFVEKKEGPARPGAPLPAVGFCFSFPMEQSALDRGILLDWTKGFSATGVVGSDPVQMLNDALVRLGRPCRVAALLNDTVGVLAAHRYLEPTTTVGVIVGTGTNACYVEKLGRLRKWVPETAEPLPHHTETAINVEWGAFHSEHLPRCEEDDHVDMDTPHAGKYLFEKLMSGMFMGEVARRILLRLALTAGLFGDVSVDPAAGAVATRLAVKGSIATAHITQIVEDKDRTLRTTGAVLQETLGVTPKQAPYSVRRTVREICVLIAQRSSLLLAVALDAILTHTGWVDELNSGSAQTTTIAFDGGVYAKFGAYREMLEEHLKTLMGERAAAAIRCQLTRDGSSLGAAVLAAAALSGSAAPPAPEPPSAKPASGVKGAASGTKGPASGTNKPASGAKQGPASGPKEEPASAPKSFAAAVAADGGGGGGADVRLAPDGPSLQEEQAV